MASRVCGRQLLRLVNKPFIYCSGCNYVKLVNRDGRQTVILFSYASSSYSQDHATRRLLLVGEVEVRSLVDLGFTECQAKELVEKASSRRSAPTATLQFCALSCLLTVGLNCSSVLKIYDKCPDLFLTKGAQLQQRIDNLRKLGLTEGNLQRVISNCPQLLALPAKRVSAVLRFLREKCLFTGQQATEILRDYPAVTLEDLGQLEYKFQYAYFRMGVGQAEMVKSGLFRVPLVELRCRHCFLERRGLYQTPDKKGQTRVANPKLKDIIAVQEETFLTRVAVATQDEFHVFRKLLAREVEEEEQELESSSSEEEEEEEEEEGGSSDTEDRPHTGYGKRRK